MGVVSVKLRSEIEDPLECLSKRLDKSKDYLINQAVKEFLVKSTLEEKRWGETLEALDSVRSGKLIDEQKINNWLESWGSANELKPPSQ